MLESWFPNFFEQKEPLRFGPRYFYSIFFSSKLLIFPSFSSIIREVVLYFYHINSSMLVFLQVSIFRTVIVKLIVTSGAGNCAIVKLLVQAGANK